MYRLCQLQHSLNLKPIASMYLRPQSLFANIRFHTGCCFIEGSEFDMLDTKYFILYFLVYLKSRVIMVLTSISSTA